MNHIEAQILEGVGQLNASLFSRLSIYCEQNRAFLNTTVERFDREVQFYVSFLDYIKRLKDSGLKFCYPHVTSSSKEVYGFESFDLALASCLVATKGNVVTNDFHLSGSERIIVVSGPNSGGKTTFARMFGQLHYLASLGCPVPGSRAQLYLFDNLFTHFEKQERITNLKGKLEDDIVRIHQILQAASPRSNIVINEIFASTALRDALFLSKRIAERMARLDTLAVWVTFIDEIACLNEQTVSMASTVEADNPAQRTFKIIRKPADGLAYAMSIAENHKLTRKMIKQRMEHESAPSLPRG